MGRSWGWVWACLLLVVGFERASWAKEEEGYLPVRVCVHPPYLKGEVILWTYYAYSTDFIYTLSKDYATKRYPRPTFLFDPNAPAANTQRLPREEDRKLSCVSRSEPPEPNEAPSPKEVEHPQASPAKAPKVEKRIEDKEEPRAANGVGSAKEGKEAEERPRPPPKQGITKDWPSSVLPRHEVEQDQTVLRRADKNDPSTTVLPYQRVLPRKGDELPTWSADDPRTALPKPEALAKTTVLPKKQVLPNQGVLGGDGAAVASGAGTGEGTGNGDGTTKGVKKTAADKVAENMAYLAAFANLQLGEDTKRPDGKAHGIVGGTNLDGPDRASIQAVVSAVMITATLLTGETKAFVKKLTSPWRKSPLLMKDMEKLGRDAADEISRKLGPEIKAELEAKFKRPLAPGEAEALVREYLAEALHKNGAIGPYEVMQQFTDKLGGRYQAHHILEVRWVKAFELGNADKVPSVILTEAEHRQFTADLAIKSKSITDTETMWAAYKDVYRKYPTWLAAIRPYIFKSK